MRQRQYEARFDIGTPGLPDCRVWQFLTRSRVCKTKSQVCKCADLSYKNHKCADLVDKYIGNIFTRQANSFEHVDVLCGLGTTLYNLPPCGAVNTISGNLGLQIFKKFSLGANHGGTWRDFLPSLSVHGNLVGNFSGVHLPNSADWPVCW